MFVDHRIYTLPHGKMKEYLERYEAEGLALQRRIRCVRELMKHGR